MNKNFKNFGLGILGGLIPLGIYFAATAYSEKTNTSERILAENQHFRQVSYNGESANAPNFVDAAENSVQSVVHVTTKVVTTQVQRDPFLNFSMGQAQAVVVNTNNTARVLARALSFPKTVIS